MDDFIACTDNITQDHILQLSRAMLHGIHTVFPPTKVTKHNGGDPISEAKLDKLEGLWDHAKEILGWLINGANFTIQLPPAKVAKIQQKLKKLTKTKRLSLNDFQKIAGTLHHAATGIPGGRGLFTVIWSAMKHCKSGWIKLTPDLRTVLDDFKWLFREIANHPINVAQLVPTLPDNIGYCDACKHAAGGVWIIPQENNTNRHVFWTCDFPADIILLFQNGLLSINDFEMAGILLEWLVLEHLLPSLSNSQSGISCDNSSAVHWTRKFTARSLTAGHLLRALALRQQICKAPPILVISIAGSLNTMADVASRYSSDASMQKHSPSLLHYFNTNFKQTTSWEEFRLPPKLSSHVMSSLRGRLLTLESWRRLPGLVKNTGTAGVVTQPASKSTRYSKPQTPSSVTSPSQRTLLGSGEATTVMDIRSKFKESLTPFRPSARPSSWLDTPAPSTEPRTHTPSRFNDV